MPSDRSERRGVTLLELLVVLVLVGLLTTLAAFALRGAPGGAAMDDASVARHRAVTEGRPVAIRMDADSGHISPGQWVRYLPDGRALGAGVDPLTGAALPGLADTTGRR
jgi:prepilin-type N-terminal cleavage/methylation domain-containing protein